MRNKGFAPIIILVIIALIGGVYFANQNMQLQKQLDPLQATPTSVPTPTPGLSTFQGVKYNYSFSYPWYFTVELNPYGITYPKQEVVNFNNETENSAIDLIEFRTIEAYWPDQSKYKNVQLNNLTFWYFTMPEYSDNKGLVVVMAEKGKELIYEFRFNGAKDFNDPVIQQILSTFKFLESKACTQEAKLCPDGSAVGRTEPDCEFAPCPTP